MKKHPFNENQVKAMKAAYQMLSAVIEPTGFGNHGSQIFPHFTEEYKKIEEILELIEGALGVKHFKKK